jgi:hypothetical protein
MLVDEKILCEYPVRIEMTKMSLKNNNGISSLLEQRAFFMVASPHQTEYLQLAIQTQYHGWVVQSSVIS